MLLALAVPFVSFAAVAESDVEAVLISKDGTEIDRGDFDWIISGVQDGDTVKMMSDVVTKTQIKIHASDVTIDGNGNTLYYAGTDYIFHFCAAEGYCDGTDNKYDDKEAGTIYLKNLTAKFVGESSGGIKTYHRTSIHCENVNIYSSDLAHLSARNCKSDDIVYTYINCNFITTNQSIFSLRPDQTLNIYGGYFESYSGRALRVNDNMTANVYGAIFATRNTKADGTSAGTAAAKSTGTLNTAGCTFINFAGEDTFVTEEGKGTINGDTGLWLNTAAGSSPIATLVDGVNLTVAGGTPAATSRTEIKFGGSAANNGIRFQTVVDSAAISRANGLKDEGTALSYGTLIVPIASLAGNSIFSEGIVKLAEVDYVDIKAKDGIIEGANGDVTVNAALVDIKVKNVDTDFTAIGYVEYVVDGITVREYGLYDAVKNTASMADLAVAALADVSATETATHVYKTADGKYSPYDETQQAVLAIYAAYAK